MKNSLRRLPRAWLWIALMIAPAPVGCAGDAAPVMALMGSRHDAITISAPITVVSPDSKANDQFGLQVSVAGNAAAVVAHEPTRGVVYVYQGAGAAWTRVATLLPPDDSPADEFGESIALSTDHLAVSSFTYGVAGGSGVYVYARAGDTWTFQQKIPAQGDFFGDSMSIDGDTLLITQADATVNVYVLSQGTWTKQSDIGPPNDSADGFGWRVAIAGSRMAIAADYEQVNGVAEAGAVYVYERQGSSWSVPTRLVADDPQPADNLGSSLAIDEDTVVAGAVYNIGGGTSTPYHGGRVLVFDKPNGTWQAHSFAGTDRETGWAVAVDGARIVYGTPFQSSMAVHAGVAFILERIAGTWTAVGSVRSPMNIDDAFFGGSIGLADTTLMVGAPIARPRVTNPPGTTYAYELNSLRKAPGEPCAKANDCRSRFCIDGVCCLSSCGGGNAHDCQACSLLAGGQQDGQCTPLSSAVAGTVVCRASHGTCDVAETCQSSATVCPADLPASNGTVCADTLTCNGQETCQDGLCKNGTPLSCPDDGDPCTVAACAEPAGCKQVPVPNCPPAIDAGAPDSVSDAGEGGPESQTDASLGDTANSDEVVVDGAANDSAPDDAEVTDAGVGDEADAAEVSSVVDGGGPDKPEVGRPADDASADSDARPIETKGGSDGCSCTAAPPETAPLSSLLALAAISLMGSRRARRRRS